LGLIFNSYLKEIDPGSLAQLHTETAANLWNVRESYLSLLTDIRDIALPIDDLRRRRDDLQAALFKIYRTAPRTDGKAYAEAQDRLKNKEDLTFSEKEIDDMLPLTLRRSERGCFSPSARTVGLYDSAAVLSFSSIQVKIL
jgi:hypothetical protein